MSLITIKAPVTEKRPLPTNPCYCKTSLGQTIEKVSSTLDSQINVHLKKLKQNKCTPMTEHTGFLNHENIIYSKYE